MAGIGGLPLHCTLVFVWRMVLSTREPCAPWPCYLWSVFGGEQKSQPALREVRCFTSAQGGQVLGHFKDLLAPARMCVQEEGEGLPDPFITLKGEGGRIHS